MSSARAAAEIEPAVRIASSRAIFPGPMRSPFSRSMRIYRRVPAMGFGSSTECGASDADAPSIVKLMVTSIDQPRIQRGNRPLECAILDRIFRRS